MRLAVILLLLAVLPLTAGCPMRSSAPADAAGWSDHMGDVPFTVGDYDSGLALSRETGKPPLYFITAHW